MRIFDGVSMVIDNQNPSFILGVQEMDATHDEFMLLVNVLVATKGERFTKLFDELLEHTQEHFDTEDHWMEQTNFPGKEDHITEHRRVLSELRYFHRKVKLGSTIMARAYLVEQVPNWFQIHSTTMDAALAKHMKNLGLEKVAI